MSLSKGGRLHYPPSSPNFNLFIKWDGWQTENRWLKLLNNFGSLPMKRARTPPTINTDKLWHAMFESQSFGTRARTALPLNDKSFLNHGLTLSLTKMGMKGMC
jgi:hypothetical protein